MTRKSDADSDRLDDAARAGWLYYIAGNTQDEIAKKLGVSRQTAQRLVSLAVSEKLIKVRLDHPIGRWLANRGLLEASTYTFADVARAAESHPDKAEQAALDNERVVFFAEVKGEAFPPPVGIAGGKLISGYSCAADQSIYPPGSVLIVIERIEGQPEPRAARFLFVHDAGGAISGPGRVDVYFGEGLESLANAGQTRRPVEIYRLRRRGS